MCNMARAIWIGVDGMPHSFLQEAIAQGRMPNFARFASDYYLGRMNAPLPDNSAVSWSSIITGTTPGEHGIFGFTDLIPNTYTLRFPNFSNLRRPPFWNTPQQRSIVINVPFTYPAAALEGKLVSGFVSPDLQKAAWPSDFYEWLREKEYRIDVDNKKAYKSRELFLKDLFSVHEKRVETYRTLFQREQWDNFMIVFTGSDRLGHFMWDIYEQKQEPYYSRFMEYFGEIDAQLGWILERVEKDDVVISMSDHGMERIHREVFLNTALEQAGYLSLEEGKPKKYTSITANTKAFVLEPSRVYLNMEGRYPAGSVRDQDREMLLQELTALFKSLTYDGRPVVRDAYTKEQLYHGDCYDDAPDIVLVQEPGFSLRGSLGKQELTAEPGMLTGMHKGSDSYVAVNRDFDTVDSILGETVVTEKLVPLVESLRNR